MADEDVAAGDDEDDHADDNRNRPEGMLQNRCPMVHEFTGGRLKPKLNGPG